MSKLVVNQILYCVPHNTGFAPFEVTVTAVKRKWAHLSNGEQLDQKTMLLKGRFTALYRYTTHGKCWVSAAAYENELLRISEWRSLHKSCWSVPDDVPLADILEAKKLLRIVD